MATNSTTFINTLGNLTSNITDDEISDSSRDLLDDESGEDIEIIHNEMNDPDYNECFMSGIPLSVFRLVYGLQFSTLISWLFLRYI